MAATKEMKLVPRSTDTLDFIPADIPDYAMKIAAMGALELTLSILRMPGGREMLDAETAARKARQAARKEKEAHRGPLEKA